MLLSELAGSFDEESNGGMRLFWAGTRFPEKCGLKSNQGLFLGRKIEDSLGPPWEGWDVQLLVFDGVEGSRRWQCFAGCG